MPCNLQGKGATAHPPPSLPGAATDTATATSSGGSCHLLWSAGGGKREGLEPRSVLDHRSLSPPTSTSTLSSSLGGGGGGGGSSDSSGVAAVSDNGPQRWPGPAQPQPSQDTTAVSAPAASEEGVSRKEEWASELHPMPFEIGLVGGEKSGIGVEEWDLMLSEAAAVSGFPGHDNSLLRWIMGESVDESSAMPHRHQLQQQHQQQVSSQSPMLVAGDFDAPVSGGGHGFSLVDPAFGFELVGGFGSNGVPNPVVGSSTTTSCSGLPLLDGNNNGGLCTVPVSSSSLPNTKPSCFGNNPTSISTLSVPSPVASNLQQLGLPQAMFYQRQTEQKEQLITRNNFLLNHQQAQTFQNPVSFQHFSPFAQPEYQQQHQHVFLPNSKPNHSMPDISFQVNPKVPFLDSAQVFYSRCHQPQHLSFRSLVPSCNIQQRPANSKLGGDEALVAEVAATATVQQLQQQQTLKEQLFKAAEFIEAGNSVNARGILARLNHQLSPHGKPLHRSAFYFKEALSAIVDATGNNGILPPLYPKTLETPLDVILKLSAYRAFSEVSPVLQFTNFTCIQVLLEELGGYNCINILDFDIGIGGQWASFMQELSQRRYSVAAADAPQLKITTFVTQFSHHPLELHLIEENLSHFAHELNIRFEFHAASLEFFNPEMILNASSGCNEAIAVNIPVGAVNSLMPAILRLVKQLSPKIVVSVDHCCDRSDLSFSRYFQNALNSYTVLLESIDASGTSMEVASKIEKFVMHPRIDGAVLGRYRAADKIGHWRTMFASTGFLPLPFSNFTETQAECLLKKIQVRGYHVEKRQSSLLLFWQHVELVSVSAWRG